MENPFELKDNKHYQDLLYKFFEVNLGGKKLILPLSRDRAARVAYIEAAKHPCAFCGGKSHVVGRANLPEGYRGEGFFVLYPVCQECFERKGPVQTKREIETGICLFQ